MPAIPQFQNLFPEILQIFIQNVNFYKCHLVPLINRLCIMSQVIKLTLAHAVDMRSVLVSDELSLIKAGVQKDLQKDLLWNIQYSSLVMAFHHPFIESASLHLHRSSHLFF